MHRIQLTGTGITTSILGFGCAQLMRIASAKSRQRLLHEAYDAGVCHFDVARMYGLGAAEGEVGRFARNKRDRLVLATKFGIDLNPRGARAAYLQGAARRLIALFPALRRVARRKTGELLQPRRYDAAKARESLETSLRELGTDYIDLFLLHEPTLGDVLQSDVFEFLEGAKAQGKIRAYGVSGFADEALAICQKNPKLAPVVQIPNDALTRSIEMLASMPERAVITYSPFSNAINRIVDHVKLDSHTRHRWFNAVGKDCISSDEVAFLLLRYSLQANPSGVVLFSTTKPERLRLLVQHGVDESSDDSSLQAFLELVGKEIVSR